MPETNSGGAQLIGLLGRSLQDRRARGPGVAISLALGPLAAKGLCLPHGLTLATESIPPFLFVVNVRASRSLP